MEEKNCEILFEYLRDIIYDSENAKLDLEQLDEPFWKLGKGLQYLDKAVKEVKHYSAEISKGNLSIEAPGRDNFLCENLKNIHANLNHLTWQAKQVAKGDYSQSVSYLGEFSEAFNTMTKQLKEREEELEEEAYRDKLTGIGNRHLFHERAETMLATGKKIVFCYCDLDHLKYVNDYFGHQEGDQYLKHFVDIVKANIRPGDLFVRLGGDEFCIVLLNCSKEIMKKKVLAVILGAVMVASMAGCGGSDTKTTDTAATETTDSTDDAENTETAEATDGESYTIGISQFAEHGSLDNCREGFLEGLKEEGIEEGKNLTVKVNNADADMGTASQIAQSFVTDNMDLICAIATPSAQAAYNAAMEKGIPVVYTAVTNPVEAELATDDKMPVGAVTGTSDQLPVEAQLKMIREILPDAKTIGILYTTSEANSVYSISQYEELADQYGFTLETAGITSSSEISLATADLLTKVDCLTNLTDNTVVSSLPAILDQANEKGIPVFGSEIEQVKIGCLAAEGIDYVSLGKDTGKMAAKILKGEVKAEDMEYQLLTESNLYVNEKVAENLGITVPDSMNDRAVETFSEISEG